MRMFIGALLLSTAPVSWATEPSSVTLKLSAQSGEPDEEHTVTIGNIDLSAYVSDETPKEGSGPRACRLQFKMTPDSAIQVEENKGCPEVIEAARSWSYKTADKLFESVEWTMQIFEIPGGPVLGVPADTLGSNPTLPPFAKSYQSVKPRKKVPPRYPASAKKDKVEARCKVKVAVSAQGKVASTEIIPNDSCPELFQKAAVTAAKKWTFKPFRIDEEAYESSYTVSFKFKME